MDGSLRRLAMNLCCIVVGLEVLAGAAVLAFIAWIVVVQGALAPLVRDLQLANHGVATIAPADYPRMAGGPPEVPAAKAAQAASDNPLVQLRQLQGSPLAGTILESCQSAADEEAQFASALELAAAQAGEVDRDRLLQATGGVSNSGVGEVGVEVLPTEPPATPGLTEQLSSHLYAMADLDEQAGEFERADRWRALARELRGPHAVP